ncbi:MAG: hypothetical protein ABJA62_07095, partial [Luteimonas sp.]
MSMIRFQPSAWRSFAGLLFASVALAGSAQAAGRCPTLDANSGLSWKQLDGPDFTFCRAIRDSDGGEAFAITIGSESPFKPKRSDRAESSSVDGRDVSWYRGELANAPGALMRETLIDLGAGRVAHISLQAASQDQLTDSLKQVGALRFDETRLSSN